MEDLSNFRKALDRIDSQLIELLGQRFEICRKVANYKRLYNVPMMQPDRVKEVQRRNAELAKLHSVNPEFAQSLYALIIGEACRLEDEIIDADPQGR
jgi:chorismate mutase